MLICIYITHVNILVKILGFFRIREKKYFVYVNVCGPAENSKAGVNLRKLMEKWEQVF